MNKRGISGVVVAILLLLIAIMAVLIFWYALRGLFNLDFDTGLLTLNLKLKFANSNGEVIVKRNAGTGNLVKLKFIFENSTASYSVINETNMKELETKKFTFDLTGSISNIAKVSIAPIVKTEKGNEKLGNIVDVYIISGWTTTPSECASDLDCGVDSYVGNNYCVGNDVYRDYQDFTCNNPGTAGSYCSSSINSQLIETCVYGCDNGQCKSQPQQNTVSLDYRYDMADIYYEDEIVFAGSVYMGSQLKWDILSIPAGGIIDNGGLCLYITGVVGSPDNDVRLWRIADQTWTESITLAEFNSMTKLNQEDSTYSSIVAGSWNCIDVTNLLRASYNAGERYFTIRFEDGDYLATNSIDIILNGLNLRTGWKMTNSLIHEDRENSGTTGNMPYLEVTYTS